jgi:hypothetical protein
MAHVPTGPHADTDGTGDHANPLSDPAFVAGLRTVPTGLPGEAPGWSAADLHGVRPDGSPVSVALAELDRPLVLVFLSVNCDGCGPVWQGLADGTDPVLDGVVAVVVTKGPDTVDPTAVAGLAAGFTGDVVMGDRAWVDYRVTGYPFLVLVDPGSTRILAETVGFGWSDLVSTVQGGFAP